MRATRGTAGAARATRRGLGLLVAAGLLAGRPSPARAQVPPGIDPRLFVIGDSVLLGAQPAIVARFTGWTVTVDAEEGLSTLAAPSIVDANRAAIGEVVIVALGNNDAGNPQTFGQRVDGVMQAIGPVRRVIWVNLRTFASWVPAMNQQLVLATSRWPNLQIADWNTLATPNPALVYGDGLHLTPAGQTAMAQLIGQTVDQYVQQRVAALRPPPRPRVPRPRPASSAERSHPVHSVLARLLQRRVAPG